MKLTIFAIFTAICGCLTACASDSSQTPTKSENQSKVLTMYFSCTGNTESVALKVNKAAGGDLLRLEPETAYTPEDLDYNTDCRANREQNDVSARPAIKTAMPDLASYDVILVGYPIWWGIAPRIIQTFLESDDLSGKTIIPFCTSGGSGISGSYAPMKQSAPNANWKEGRKFSAGDSQTSVTKWVESVIN